jgi:hypothetical protein
MGQRRFGVGAFKSPLSSRFRSVRTLAEEAAYPLTHIKTQIRVTDIMATKAYRGRGEWLATPLLIVEGIAAYEGKGGWLAELVLTFDGEQTLSGIAKNGLIYPSLHLKAMKFKVKVDGWQKLSQPLNRPMAVG